MGKGSISLAEGSVQTDAKEFFNRVIPLLRSPGYEGVHCVYGHLNETIAAFYGFDKAQVRSFTDQACADGIIHTNPVKGGVLVFLGPSQPREKTQGINPKVLHALKALQGTK
jgi:hypothetical protein